MSFTAEIIAEEVRASWRKSAAAASSVAAQTSKQDVEKAFLDQAYMLIQNKGTPLMKAPYRVGFEIVFKNDENNRLVGIFVFRVDDDLYYAPCFFLGGTIKGTDLLYRHTEKQFVPLTTDWAEYLIAQADDSLGSGVPMSERSFTRHQLELRDLAQPPNSQQSWRKYSSAGVQDPDIRAFWDAHKDMLKPAAEDQSLLKKFVKEDGGFAARMALARAAKKKPAFGKALVTHSKPENFAPDMDEAAEKPAGEREARLEMATAAKAKVARSGDKLMPVRLTDDEVQKIWDKHVAGTEKKACLDVSETLLTVRTGLLRNPGVKSASAEELARDWQAEDFRKDAEVNEEVYNDPRIYLEQVTGPGVYDMLTVDGDLGPYLAAPELPSSTLRSRCPGEPEPVYPTEYYARAPRTKLVFVDLKTKESCCVPTGVSFGSSTAADHGAMGKYTGKLDTCGDLKDTVESGKAYRMVVLEPEGISDPFYVLNTDQSPGGLKQAWISHYSKDENERLPLILNPEFKGFDAVDKVCGTGVKFIEVHKCPDKDSEVRISFGDNIRLGGSSALNSLIYDNHYKRASIRCAGPEEYLVDLFDGPDRSRSPRMGKLAAMVHVAGRCNVRMELAEELLKQARTAEHGTTAFYFRPFTKAGYNVSFNEWPNLHATGNTEFQTLEEPYIQDVIRARRDDPYIVPHRIGDAYRHEGINSARDLDMTTPLNLAQQSATRGVSSLFEHGVVGELVKTYDATALVDKYLPELLIGLDRLGRLLFLLYWKPQDFAQDYGADDQTELENQMLSNFKQQGALVLSLLQKSDALKRPDSIGARMP